MYEAVLAISEVFTEIPLLKSFEKFQRRMPGAGNFCNVTGFKSCGLNIIVRDAMVNLQKIFQIKFLLNILEGMHLTSG